MSSRKPASCRRHWPPEIGPIPRDTRPAPRRSVRGRGTRRTFLAAAATLCLLAAAGRPAAAADVLEPLVTGLKWPHVSSLIAYRGRLWFVNSRKYVNHNSADLWSWDPAAGAARYERHLFSQDAGDPVVHGGLLYWPFEDSRFSPGRGEFMATNGEDWQWGLLPEGRAFHVHAMASSRGALYAAQSAWVARLQVSRDGGAAWSPVYAHPTPDQRISRITALADFEGTLYGGLTAWYRSRGAKILRWDGKTFRQVRGWPEGNAVPRLQSFGGWLYGVNLDGEGGSLWRTNGRIVEEATATFGRSIRGMAADEDRFWIVRNTRSDGELWRSGDGLRWSLFQSFRGVKLHGVAVLGGEVYVGGADEKGGLLLGPPPRTADPGDGGDFRAGGNGDLLPPPPRLPQTRRADAEAARALAELRTALGDPSAYGPDFRVRLGVLARTRDAATGRALAAFLDGPFPDAEVRMFGRSRFPAAKMARWYLLWAMAHNGNGRVPVEYIAEDWTAAPNRAEKYLDAPPAAAWAAAQLGQKDDATLAALVARLDRAGDPDWLAGDAVGALTVLTGQRFAYDIAAWKQWWAGRR